MKIVYVTHVRVRAMCEEEDGRRVHRDVDMPVEDFARLFVAGYEPVEAVQKWAQPTTRSER
jgi:hypothetical protein